MHNDTLHQKLAEILDSGNSAAIITVEESILAAYDRLQSQASAAAPSDFVTPQPTTSAIR